MQIWNNTSHSSWVTSNPIVWNRNCPSSLNTPWVPFSAICSIHDFSFCLFQHYFPHHLSWSGSICQLFLPYPVPQITFPTDQIPVSAAFCLLFSPSSLCHCHDLHPPFPHLTLSVPVVFSPYLNLSNSCCLPTSPPGSIWPSPSLSSGFTKHQPVLASPLPPISLY